jgi:hypothetical protein
MIIDRQPGFYDDLLTNNGLFKPYSTIMVNSYGTGNNSVSAITNNGYLTDAIAYGARLDYALAANLNLCASLFWADRLSHGYGWGFIRPDVNDLGIANGMVYYTRHSTIDSAPAIPDPHLGYEINCGVNWDLLESYNLAVTFAYWKPGGWFRFACIDRSNPGWKTPNASNNFGVRPDRVIDPIFALDVKLKVSF